jgi:hypothetical protein
MLQGFGSAYGGLERMVSCNTVQCCHTFFCCTETVLQMLDVKADVAVNADVSAVEADVARFWFSAWWY